MAIRLGDRVIVEALLCNGRVHGKSVPGVDWVVDPQLHVVALWDRVIELGPLLEAGFDINGVCKAGYTAMHIAAFFGNNRVLQVRPSVLHATWCTVADRTLRRRYWTPAPIPACGTGSGTRRCTSRP